MCGQVESRGACAAAFDALSVADTRRMVDAVASHFGRLDILVNSVPSHSRDTGFGHSVDNTPESSGQRSRSRAAFRMSAGRVARTCQTLVRPSRLGAALLEHPCEIEWHVVGVRPARDRPLELGQRRSRLAARRVRIRIPGRQLECAPHLGVGVVELARGQQNPAQADAERRVVGAASIAARRSPSAPSIRPRLARGACALACRGSRPSAAPPPPARDQRPRAATSRLRSSGAHRRSRAPAGIRVAVRDRFAVLALFHFRAPENHRRERVRGIGRHHVARHRLHVGEAAGPDQRVGVPQAVENPDHRLRIRAGRAAGRRAIGDRADVSERCQLLQRPGIDRARRDGAVAPARRLVERVDC